MGPENRAIPRAAKLYTTTKGRTINIKVSINLHMSDEQLQSWANEYGLSTDEVEADAHGTIGDIIKEAVERTYHVAEFATITRYTVR